jgi:hypothetical protein
VLFLDVNILEHGMMSPLHGASFSLPDMPDYNIAQDNNQQREITSCFYLPM